MLYFDHAFYIQFQFIVFVLKMVVLVGYLSGLGFCGRLKQGRGCRNFTECLIRANRGYLLVEKVPLANNNTHSNRPVPAGTREGTRYCPWIWTLDDNPNRLPRYLARAECHNCNFNCRAVFYSHSTLERRCTHKSPVCTWRRIEMPLEIAYVFDLDKK